MAQSAIQGSSSPVIGARGVFGFDLTKPLRGGWLLKQGGSHKAFKKRFFVLYPGFLIYYSSPDKYKYDVARSTLAVSCPSGCPPAEGVCSVAILPPSPLLLLSLPHSLPSSESSLCHQAQRRRNPYRQVPTEGLSLRLHCVRPRSLEQEMVSALVLSRFVCVPAPRASSACVVDSVIGLRVRV